ncbi:hypothetical protein SAMN04488044_1273 [Cognatishimia maritima]|uniref:Transposase n=1 Tax=Cognatishimia maritima TaxID=870908 RepID=A0A1M5MLZ4_9RHOB|nr:hypothetical protein SAMN04488044_1273 [Cognatishimia maritima]
MARHMLALARKARAILPQGEQPTRIGSQTKYRLTKGTKEGYRKCVTHVVTAA